MSSFEGTCNARGIVVILFILATLSVCAREGTRKIRGFGPAIDDYFAYLAYINLVALLGTTLWLADFGAFSDSILQSLNKGDITVINKVGAFAFVGFWITAVLTVKLSVLFLYRRIFTLVHTWFRNGWWTNFVLLFPFWAVLAFTVFALQNVSAIHQSGRLFLGGGRRVQHSLMTVGWANAVSDILILALPIRTVICMMLPRKQKVALMAVFGIGLIGTAATIARVIVITVKLPSLAKAQFTYVIASVVECTAGLICACLPVTKPLLTHISKNFTRLWKKWTSYRSSSRRKKGEPRGAIVNNEEISVI